MNTILDSNIAYVERVARMGIGFALVSSVMFFGSVVPAWVSLFAVYPVITAIMAWDPIYAAVLKARCFVEPLGHGHNTPLAS